MFVVSTTAKAFLLSNIYLAAGLNIVCTQGTAILEYQPYAFICSGFTSVTTQTRTIQPCSSSAPPDVSVTETRTCPAATSCVGTTIPPASDCARPCTATVLTFVQAQSSSPAPTSASTSAANASSAGSSSSAVTTAGDASSSPVSSKGAYSSATASPSDSSSSAASSGTSLSSVKVSSASSSAATSPSDSSSGSSSVPITSAASFSSVVSSTAAPSSSDSSSPLSSSSAPTAGSSSSLLEAGADPSLVDENGDTAVTVAWKNGRGRSPGCLKTLSTSTLGSSPWIAMTVKGCAENHRSRRNKAHKNYFLSVALILNFNEKHQKNQPSLHIIDHFFSCPYWKEGTWSQRSRPNANLRVQEFARLNGYICNLKKSMPLSDIVLASTTHLMWTCVILAAKSDGAVTYPMSIRSLATLAATPVRINSAQLTIGIPAK